jgi:hypothetical protein
MLNLKAQCKKYPKIAKIFPTDLNSLCPKLKTVKINVTIETKYTHTVKSKKNV